MALPEPATDFVRLALFVKRPRDYTPGAIATLLGIDPDHIGLIAVEDKQIIIDVHKVFKRAAKDKLADVGGCKVLHDVEMKWHWMRLNLGRNHGLTMRKLRLTLEDAEAQPVGKIHLNNNYTIIGLREDRFDHLMVVLADKVINGVALQPRMASQAEHRDEDPRYYQRDPSRRG